ncbi:MAG: hypothetical protein ABS75_31465 [Pelagibacterium sp. SCN 63-23]|nr:MAG: hypothetical protein ABS75_31465 [Pelagibacterium sp. SCN 63-23]
MARTSASGELTIWASGMSSPPGPTRDIFDADGRALRHKGLRQANEKTVLTVVAFNSGVSNAEIARMSGLAPQTVSAILSGLGRDGLVERGEALRGRRGQPATPILLNKDGAYAIGVELGWRHADVILLNLHAQVLGHYHIDYAYPDAHTLFDFIVTSVEKLKALLPPERQARLIDVGLALPGGLAEGLANIGAPEAQSALWRDIDARAELATRTGLDVSVYNDGNAACWAEMIALERPRPANIIYFLVSHYVGAGVIGDGMLWNGPTGNAANLGLMLVRMDGAAPRQAYLIASLFALGERLAAAGKPHDISAWRQWDWASIEPEVASWIADSAKALAWTAYNATTVLEEPLIIVDTVFGADITQRLATQFRAELAALPVTGMAPPPVRTGGHGALAPAIGAAELPLFNRYF